MKNKQYLVILVLGILILTLVVFFVRKTESPLNVNPPSEQLQRQRKGGAKMESKVGNSSGEIALQAERISNALKNIGVPLEFWGVVIDQDGDPIANALIDYRVLKAGNINEMGILEQLDPRNAIKTDSVGRFHIDREFGVSLIIESITKEGYKLNSNQRLDFGYVGTPEIHLPKQDSPISFLMIGSKSEAKIVEDRLKLVVPWDGTPVVIDLDSFQRDKFGDLTLTATRDLGKKRFDWEVSVRVLGGGVRYIENGKGLVAPEEGYLEEWKCEFPDENGDWLSGYDANLFFRKGDVFGRLVLQMYADASPGSVGIYIDRYLNEDGGRVTGK